MKSPLVKEGRAPNLLNQQSANCLLGKEHPLSCLCRLPQSCRCWGGSELELNGQEVVVTGTGGVGVAVPAAEPGVPRTPRSFPAAPRTEKPKLFPNCTAFPFLAGGRGGLAPSPHAGINLEPIPCADFSPGGRALGLDVATWVCAPHGLIPQQGCAGGGKSCPSPIPLGTSGRVPPSRLLLLPL